MSNLDAINKLFREAYKDFLETGKMPEPTAEQLERRKKQQEWETYVNSLPPLGKGVYKVRCLRDVYSLWNTIVGKEGDVLELKNDGMKAPHCSMGTRHYSGCINQDGGMSPSELYVPGIDIEILEKIK